MDTSGDALTIFDVHRVTDGNVVANDDSQVFAMLLASNPQLQKVSKERAMKILKAKFPEYFD